MYFEAGQSSVLSANANFSVDQQTSPVTPIPNFSQLKVTLLTIYVLLAALAIIALIANCLALSLSSVCAGSSV